MPEYFHHKGGLSQPRGFSVVREQILSVDGSRVLAVQYTDEAKAHYVGIGFVNRYKHDKFAGIEISDVTSLNLPNGFYRPDLEKAVREAGFEGMIISLL